MDEGTRPLSVAHLLAPAAFGGLETVVVTLSRALVRGGAEVTVVLVLTPDDPHAIEHPVALALEGSDVTVERWVLPGRAYGEERRRVRHLLEDRGIDVLHTHGYRPDVIDAPVARALGRPTVSTVHGRIGLTLKGRIFEWMQTRAHRRFDAVIAVSDKLVRELTAEGVPAERVHLLPNAWEPSGPSPTKSEARVRLGLPRDDGVVGWVGRMGTEKGPDVMVHVAAAVDTPDVRFSLVGDGPEREACEALARELGVHQRVRFHGSVPGAGSLVTAFDALVLSSWTEGTPMVLLEAMAAGVPVVVTAVGGVPDVVSESEAHLRDPGDVSGLAAAVDDVFARPEAARARASAARCRLEREFAVEPWARRHLDLYAALTRR